MHPLRVFALVFVVLFANAGVAAADLRAASGVVGGEFTYSVRKGDSLTSVGARFGVSQAALVRDNRLSAPYRLKIGQQLRIDNRHLVPEALPEGIVINIPQRMLFLFQDARVAASYPVALGRPDWETPTGNFHITQLEKHKTWCVPKSIQEEMRRAGKPVLTEVPPGPDNPLGEYWMGLSVAGYGIHSTIAPASIYGMRTHGCIRLHPEDAAALYARARLKMPVQIIYAPVLLLKLDDGRVLAEVNPDVYNRGGDPLQTLRDAARSQGLEAMIDWNTAAGLARAREGLAREAGGASSRSGGNQ
ncbi:MAG TPA: L,D-transpeptidase family protein [Burkholderiales bacterium]|nr:L,D-transpeptidase family protein [Burkholderiales bacterium]